MDNQTLRQCALVAAGFLLSTVFLRSETSKQPTASVTGTYSEVCVAASNQSLQATTLLSLLFAQPDLAQVRIGAVASVTISQERDRLRVTGADDQGVGVFSHDLLLGKGYAIKNDEIVISMNWSGDDEWGRSKGQTENHLSKAQDGRLVVRSEIAVSRRGLFGIPSQRHTTYTYMFSAEQSGAKRP